MNITEILVFLVDNVVKENTIFSCESLNYFDLIYVYGSIYKYIDNEILEEVRTHEILTLLEDNVIFEC